MKIAGREFNSQTMAGKGYVTEYPALLQAVSQEAGLTATLQDQIPIVKIYLELGKLELNCNPWKSFYPGMILELYGDNNPTLGHGFVVSYSAVTGRMVLNIQGYSNGAVIHGPLLKLKHVVNNAIPSGTLPVSVANRGTASKAIENALEVMRYTQPKTDCADIVDDFVGFINPDYPRPYEVALRTGNSKCYSYPKPTEVSAFDPLGRIGFMALSAGNGQIVLKRGKGNCNIKNSEIFRTDISFFIPVLSDATNRFELRLGLPSEGSTLSSIGTYGGIVLTYTDNQNSGNFRILYGNSGSSTYLNTSATAVANTWHTLSLIASSTDLIIRIDGVSVGTITFLDLEELGDSGVNSLALSLNKVTGSAERVVILDMVNQKKDLGRVNS